MEWQDYFNILLVKGEHSQWKEELDLLREAKSNTFPCQRENIQEGMSEVQI